MHQHVPQSSGTSSARANLDSPKRMAKDTAVAANISMIFILEYLMLEFRRGTFSLSKRALRTVADRGVSRVSRYYRHELSLHELPGISKR
mmetsp:Transcript_21604/g.47109  ORF Transcript_21604/g.47109 Transcript_21604/m.47109 type:complete len:90 (+) Transcript_21604:352-621(+)